MQRRKPRSRTSRALAAKRARAYRQRRKEGAERVSLTLPRLVRDAWIVRQRLGNDNAPLPFEHFDADMVDILTEWAVRWIRTASRRDAS